MRAPPVRERLMEHGMASGNFDVCIKRLLAHEGGYSNHPSDPGGPTNFGITIHDYRKYVNAAAGAADVRAMPLATARAIYRAKYWDALRCDELASGVDYAVFDYGVNSGAARASRVLARTLGRSGASDRIDAEILALARARDPAQLIRAIWDERMSFLRRLRTWPVFGVGWTRRVSDVRAVSLALAAKQNAPADKPVTRAGGKGAVPVNTTAQKGTAGGALAGGAAGAGQAAQNGASPGVIIAILVIAILLAIGGWLFWRWRQRRQQLAVA
jgi:lysozyme family protein